jgi:hypothetical protein
LGTLITIKENIMNAAVRMTILMVTIGMLIACVTTTLPKSFPGESYTSTPAGSTPTGSMAGMETSSTQTVPAIPAKPAGITAVNNFEPNSQAGSFFIGKIFQDQTYTNPSVSGLTFRTSWADIEPAEDSFVWTKLDTVFDTAEKNGKWVELVLIPGFGSPAWALQGVQTSMFSVNYGPGKGTQLLLPPPWDQTYLNRWFTFLKMVSARYENRPSFLKIAADGPTSITAEMTLPDAPADICNWVNLGYTSDRLIGSWKQVFADFAQIFPRQYFSLALYPPLPIIGKTHCENGNPIGLDHAESQRVRDAIIALGVDNYPQHFVLQENGLIGAPADPTNSAYELVKSFSGRIVIGYQLSTSAMQNPGYMGGVSDGATALQMSLQKGLDANPQFLEVYEPDVLAPGAQSELASVANQLASAAH